MRVIIFAILILLFQLKVWAAPHPLTGSSLINKPDNALAFSQLGFKVSGIPDNWVFNKSFESTQPVLEIGLPKKTLLSFRQENVSSKTQLETYVRQYLRDYNQYGFEVAGLQSLVRNEVPSVIVDLNQKNKSSRSRQIFFLNQNKLVVATCTDEVAKFNSTLLICNQILANFMWK